jgi:hypothetical protein
MAFNPQNATSANPVLQAYMTTLCAGFMTLRKGYGNFPLMLAQYSTQTEYIVPKLTASDVAPNVDAGRRYLFSKMKKSAIRQGSHKNESTYL